jgi:excinuclease ABC subunit A
VPCATFGGARHKPLSLGRDHRRLPRSRHSDKSIADSVQAPAALSLSERERLIAERVVKEINARMGFLLDVGLDYLTLSPLGGHRWPAARPSASGLGLPDRQRPGGRAVRAGRASIGLHSADNRGLIEDPEQPPPRLGNTSSWSSTTRRPSGCRTTSGRHRSRRRGARR